MRLQTAALALASMAASSASAGGLHMVRFLIVDPVTGKPVPGAVTILDSRGRKAELKTNLMASEGTQPFDTVDWLQTVAPPPMAGPFAFPASPDDPTTITIPIGASITLVQQDQVPTKEITIRVTATRLVPNRAPTSVSSNDRTREQIEKFVNTTSADTRQLTKGQAGITEDSAGQQHARGEHTDIAYVIDGVMLPDSLSGRQGSVVVPSTIQNLEIITGGFAPEFGEQTAAILNITTLGAVKKEQGELTLQDGSFNSYAGDVSSQGPLGPKMSYVIDLNAQRTGNEIEPQQPDDQSAHNAGWSESVFTKLHFTPNAKDDLALTVSENPDATQIGNRAGLPAAFSQAGEGYGFLGLRNADGTIPTLNSTNAGLLGSQKMVLPSQQAEGMDIDQHEVNEFAVLNYVRKISHADTAQLSLTVMHSSQDVTNHNPLVDLGQLPVDNSIEYNPTASRNVHHIQETGSYELKRGGHDIKMGFLLDQQSGQESYQIIPASQLALDELAALDPALAPTGHSNPKIVDVYGNPVFTATGQSPTLLISRTGAYEAGYAQDTWVVGRLTADYGMRFDWYYQKESISTTAVYAFQASPRLNFDYKLDKVDDLRWSYNRLFDTPPLAQGGVVGEPIQPETISQYDLAISRKVRPNQTATLAYYYKDIRNQVDVGLLVPGSEIGLYSAVNFQVGAVHGIEFSYDISAPHGVGWDEYLNYSHSAAQPNGLDNTGALAPNYNDHDQRDTVGLGLAYTWKSGYSVAGTYQYNSGLASSIVPPDTDRISRTQLDLHMTTGDRVFQGRGGFEVDVSNLFDSRNVINFQSGFSGTRFQQGRSITVGAHYKF